MRINGREVPAGFPAYERETFDFIAQRNDGDIAQIHADQKMRTQAAVMAQERFEREAEALIKERRVPMTDSFSGKYDLVTAQNRLKTEIRTKEEPTRIAQIGNENLGTNVFLKDIDTYDVVTYDYKLLKQ